MGMRIKTLTVYMKGPKRTNFCKVSKKFNVKKFMHSTTCVQKKIETRATAAWHNTFVDFRKNNNSITPKHELELELFTTKQLSKWLQR
jgi:hypothetical protein